MNPQCRSSSAQTINEVDKYTMQEFDKIGEDLFNKIRGRFPEVTIGDETGTVTNEPTRARFFDFDYQGLGKVSVSISEDEGLTVIYSKDFISNEDEQTQQQWYNFLKELRVFSKKRMLDYSVRDITKSNLNKRDYKFLAKNSEEEKMTESKLYGSSRISYQRVGEARIMIKHTENINTESTTGRTQKIGAIYIESTNGERFKYPYKHLSGARAMAMHVSEGGNAYDDFGKHITGLSEELSKLRKFKTYMGRSAVMAESLAGYMDIVKERISTVKKTIESLQKPAYYKETFEAFETPVLEDVPSDVAENWIDELTIKQFNEELQDIFPYIYNLVKEGTKAKELGPDDLVDEGERHGNDKMYDKCWDGYKKVPGKKRGEKGSCVKEEDELERGFEEMMGQFAEAKKCEECNCAPCECDTNEADLDEAYIKSGEDAINTLGALRKIGKRIETGDDEYEGNLANMYVNDVYDVISWVENNLDTNEPNYQKVLGPVIELRKKAKGMERELGSGKDARFGNQIVNTLYPLMQWIEMNAQGSKVKEDEMDPDGKVQAAIEKFLATNPKNGDDLQAFHHKAISDRNKELDDYLTFLYDYVADQTGAGGTEEAGVYDEMLDTLTQMMADKGWSEGNAFAHAVRKAKMDGKKKGDKVKGPDGDEITLEKEQKTPLGEFILSYYDRQLGEFPKGETAVLTMVEKDYGEQFIEPAKAFIEQVNALYDEFQMRTQPQQMETDTEFNRMRELAGLR